MSSFGVENPATPQETIPVKLGESYKSIFGNDNVSVGRVLLRSSKSFAATSLGACLVLGRRLPNNYFHSCSNLVIIS